MTAPRRAVAATVLVVPPLESLPKIAAPATRALASVGITSLGQLADYPRAKLAALHGMGPKALSVLEANLSQVGLRLGD